MDNGHLWWMSKQEFLKVLYLDFYSILICINDLSDNLTSSPKFSADDTSLFSTVTDLNVTANQINNDLHNIIHGLTNGKWILLLILVNKNRRSYLAIK